MSDVVIPRMGGIELFQPLRERGIETPVVLVTGHPMEEELRALLAQRLSGYLLQPPRTEELSRLMADLLGCESGVGDESSPLGRSTVTERWPGARAGLCGEV